LWQKFHLFLSFMILQWLLLTYKLRNFSIHNIVQNVREASLVTQPSMIIKCSMYKSVVLIKIMMMHLNLLAFIIHWSWPP
jgi:hypothetical protein